MKKFLTVLLALSVVFTYTVGTAFAADEPTYAQKLKQAKASVMNTLDTNYDSMVRTLADDTVDGYKISKEAWLKVAGELKAAKADAIDKKAQELSATEDPDATIISLTDAIASDVGVSVSELYDGLKAQTDKDDYVDAAARYQYELDKAEFIRLAGTVDLNVYSKTTPADAEETYYEQAKAVVDAGIDKINNPAKTITNTSNVADVAEAYGQIRDSFNWRFVETEAGSGVYKLASRYDNILKIADETANATTLEAKKAALNSAVAAEAANYMADCAAAAKADPNFDMDAAKELKEAYVTAHTYRIDNLDSLADADAYAAKINDVTGATSVIAEVKAVAELNAYAEKYKAEKDASGNLIRDPEAVDKIVDDATAKIYSNLAASTDTIKKYVADAQKAIADNKVATLSKDVVGLAKAAIEKNREADLAKYYELEQAAVNAKYDELIAKVDAATTDTEVGKVAKKATLTGISDKTAVNALYTSGACKTEFGNLVKKLSAYETYLKSADSKKDFDNYDPAYWQAFCIDNNARTGAEVAALYDKAQGILDAVQNSDAIKAERKAVEDKINALPATITTSDAAAVEEAWTAMNNYLEKNNIKVNDVVNDYLLTSAINDLYNAELKAVNDAVKALPAKITAADKDALNAIVDQIDAINDQIGDGLLFEGKAKVNVPKSVKDALDNIRASELKAVVDAINALPLNITEADKAAVEAARAAYDAYVEAYTDYAAGDIASEDVKNASDLFKAEATLTVLAKEKGIEAVQALKITASSTAKKGSITVKWKVKGDATYADGFQVYRSKKMNSGYGTKAFFTTDKNTKRTYKNTKSLKKGTRYYYKVRAYKVVDGKTYYSDWSNKAYRIAK